MRTIEQIKADLEKNSADWIAEIEATRGLKQYDAIQNDGGEGYSAYEDASEARAEKYGRIESALRKELFEAEWTKEVTQQRREAWNARVKAGEFGVSKIDMKKYKAAVADQGWGTDDLRCAIKMHGL